MIDLERMSKYMDLLECKRFITASEFMASMEISYATFKRDLAVLRDRFDVPIIYDRDVGAYRLDQSCNRTRLPGVWFSPGEIQIMRNIFNQLLHDSDPEGREAYQDLKSKFHRLS